MVNSSAARIAVPLGILEPWPREGDLNTETPVEDSSRIATANADEPFAGLFLPGNESDLIANAARDRVFSEIERLDLVKNIGELEMRGYTVLSPDQVGTIGFTTRLRDNVIGVIERRTGERLDLATGISGQSESTAHGQVKSQHDVLLENPVFEEALMNEAVLAVVTYLLGESCTLHHQRAAVKYPGNDHLELHADQNQSGGTSPFPAAAQVCNATYALTDHTVEAGTTCFVPGSHKLCRPPTASEATDISSFVPLLASAGSVAIWHGNTWHGSVPRTAPGLRVSLVQYFQRWYYQTPETAAADIGKEVLDRNPPRFATLVGVRQDYMDRSQPAFFRAARTGLYA
jgi:ectoine hydroxylase-related dioxygenase (phytanoyl-CoA dioxygenase family)